MSEEMLKERLRLLHEDVSRILEKLGMDEDRAHTDGGYLNVPRILNQIQETLDALAQATQFGASMSDKYALINGNSRALIARWRDRADVWPDTNTEHCEAISLTYNDCADDLEEISGSTEPLRRAEGATHDRPFAYFNADESRFFWFDETKGAPVPVSGIVSLYIGPSLTASGKLSTPTAQRVAAGNDLVDKLAQEIRRVDGNHSLGAGALAEVLVPFIRSLAPPQTGEAVACKRCDGDGLRFNNASQEVTECGACHVRVRADQITDMEVIGVQCLDGGKCHHGCKTKCSRRSSCVPLSIADSYLNADWSLKAAHPAAQAEGRGVDAERREDMSPTGRLRLHAQDDGDMCVMCIEDDGTSATVEFCASGGRSPKTLQALRNLSRAMQADNGPTALTAPADVGGEVSK